MRLVPSLLAGVVAVALLATGTALRAQQPPANQAGRNQPKVRVLHSEMPALPGYYMLRMQHVQKELELTPEQLEQLKALGKKFYEAIRADQAEWKNWREMTPEERTAKSTEMREKYKKRADQLRHNIENVLLPHQIKTLREINFRTMGPSALSNPNTLNKIGVSDEQKEKLLAIRQEMLEKYQELQKRAFERSLKVLTPEQREKLKDEIQGGNSY